MLGTTPVRSLKQVFAEIWFPDPGSPPLCESQAQYTKLNLPTQPEWRKRSKPEWSVSSPLKTRFPKPVERDEEVVEVENETGSA